MAVSKARVKGLQRVWERMWPFSGPLGRCWTAHDSQQLESQGSAGLMASSSASLRKRSWSSEEMEDTLEAGVSCAMCGLHMTGEMCSDTSSDEEYVARNVETLSPEVVEHGGLVHLFLEDWELARVALSCHLASDLLCQEFQEAWLLLLCCHSCLPLLLRLNASPILEVLRQYGVGCDGRTSRVSLHEHSEGDWEGCAEVMP